MKSEHFKRQIEDEETEGWSVGEDGDEKVVMYKAGYGTLGGHVLVGLLTIWWTFGIGNVIYAAYKHWGDRDKKVVRDEHDGPDHQTRGSPDIDASIGSDVETIE